MPKMPLNQLIICDSVRKQKDGTYLAKSSYFYRHGRTAQMLEARVKAAVPEATVVEVGDRWNNWPKESYFFVRFTVPQEA